VNHELVSFDDPLNDSYLPLVIVKYVYPVSHLQYIPPILHLRRLRDPFELIARPLVSEPHLYHEDIAILDNKFF
jgi:hypothetical protein